MQYHNFSRRKRAKYVVSIGGNALNYEGDKFASLADSIRFLYKYGDIVITHGNGPQVGELAIKEKYTPLAILTAQTQAEIGMFLKNKVEAALSFPEIAIVITSVEVNPNDPSFLNPTKPIGRFYNTKEARLLMRRGYKIKKLIGGYRRVVPSPRPLKVLEIPLITRLLNFHMLVIAGGGGGIPVFQIGKKRKLAEGVVDKDLTASLIASAIKADMLIILTDVDGAYINYRRKGQKLINKATASEMEKYLKGGIFEEGSMKPKVEACVNFVKETGKTAAIGNLSKAKDVVTLNNCTVVIPDGWLKPF